MLFVSRLFSFRWFVIFGVEERHVGLGGRTEHHLLRKVACLQPADNQLTHHTVVIINYMMLKFDNNIMIITSR